MKKQEFLDQVINDVMNIKNNATAKEIAKLDFNKFRPGLKNKCLFGQMTGDSETKRANELAKKTIGIDSVKADELKESGVELTKEHGVFTMLVGGSPRYTERILDVLTTDVEAKTTVNLLSPIELFFAFDGANSEDVFKFLKGEIPSFEPVFGEHAVVE